MNTNLKTVALSVLCIIMIQNVLHRLFLQGLNQTINGDISARQENGSYSLNLTM